MVFLLKLLGTEIFIFFIGFFMLHPDAIVGEFIAKNYNYSKSLNRYCFVGGIIVFLTMVAIIWS